MLLILFLWVLIWLRGAENTLYSCNWLYTVVCIIHLGKWRCLKIILRWWLLWRWSQNTGCCSCSDTRPGPSWWSPVHKHTMPEEQLVPVPSVVNTSHTVQLKASHKYGCSNMEKIIIITITLITIEITTITNDYFWVWKRDAFIQHFSPKNTLWMITLKFPLKKYKNCSNRK